MATNSSTNLGQRLFGALLAFSLLAAAASYWWLSREPGDLSGGFAQQTLLAHRAALHATSAAAGDDAAFDALAGMRTRLPDAGASAAQVAQAGGDPQTWSRGWRGIHSGIGSLLDSRQSVADANRAARQAPESVTALLTQMGNLAAQLNQQRMAEPLAQFEATARSVPQHLRTLAAGSGDSSAASAALSDAQAKLDATLRDLAGEDAGLNLPNVTEAQARQQLDEVRAALDMLNTEVRTGLDAAAGPNNAQMVLRNMRQDVGRLDSVLDTLPVRDAVGPIPAWAPLAATGVAVLSLFGMWTHGRRRSSAEEQDTEALTRQAEDLANRNERNQAAILNLLDELGSLADGDLTVQATVTEDITGAIADSINYAIEALRGLVTTINSAAHNVRQAAQQTKASANHLARASDNQSKQVFAATESIAEMAESIEEVSGNAERSAEVARHSVEIAHKGGEDVRRTIDGMNTIRETIQETAKRIKRLGESSQEIGNIVELINDIAEQTNILALNASIQASAAGEAGRGFAVVADEVQRLAERSANATKQIEVLVKTIQSDTNEAVVSMERSTTDVVSGALLAENAGGSLDEIEKVSNQIATLVSNISATARQQATAAADITRNMGVLQEISTQTAENTGATSGAIGELTVFATDLSKSVAGFTLPADPAPDAYDKDALAGIDVGSDTAVLPADRAVGH